MIILLIHLVMLYSQQLNGWFAKYIEIWRFRSISRRNLRFENDLGHEAKPPNSFFDLADSLF